MIGVSAGTAAVLGMNHSRCDCYPTTAYFMLGKGCQGNCKFCAQSKGGSARTLFLSRIAWPDFPIEELYDKLSVPMAIERFKRVCFQIVNNPGVLEKLEKSIARLRRLSDIPISVSCNCLDMEHLERLMELGIDKVAIPLDTATPSLFSELKGGRWEDRIALLIEASVKFPGQVATHLIAGLGETEADMVGLMELLFSHQINVALFAFTPVPGTELAGREPPALDFYRRLQAAHYLLKKGLLSYYSIRKGKVHLGEKPEALASALGNGEAFETSGCCGCNRPYYNERPGRVPYNYPEKLQDAELKEALLLLKRDSRE